jgi:hypothetical protein
VPHYIKSLTIAHAECYDIRLLRTRGSGVTNFSSRMDKACPAVSRNVSRASFLTGKARMRACPMIFGYFEGMPRCRIFMRAFSASWFF